VKISKAVRKVLWGLAETFVPVAETFVQAHRGRVRYYRLTDAGRQILREGVA
jgi:DNA-binding PadR family transcriptional regulator